MARARRDTGNARLGGNIGMPAIGPGMNKIPEGTSEDDAATDDLSVIQRAIKRFAYAQSFWDENRQAGLADDRMYNGEQWGLTDVQMREADHRPCLTFNQFPTLVHQVANDQRQTRPGINVSPVGDKSDPEAAKMLMGLVRHIERESHADIAYDTAYESTVRKGWGYWRLVTEYESPETFDQRLSIRRIRNAYSVYMDPGMQEPDGSDARYAFITEMIPRSEFLEQFPDADPVSWNASATGDALRAWIGESEIRIAEYFEVEHKPRRLVMLENGHEGWWDELSAAAKRLPVIAERESVEPVVKWYKLTCKEVIEERDWPGRWIPIAQVVGDELDIEGKLYLSGMIRHAHDAQRQYNYMRTAFVESAALAPKAHYVMAEGQQEGHEEEWKMANIRSLPYLLYRPVDVEGRPAPPPERQQPVQPPAALVEGAREASQDLMMTVGVRFNANPEQERMYDESGRALRELRRAGDIGSFHYIDNLARALRHTGAMLLDLIPHIYDRRRVLTILREDGSEQRAIVDPDAGQPYAPGKSNGAEKPIPIFNPTIGRYGVTVTVGPSYATKRIEAAESIMDFVRSIAPAAPDKVGAIVDLIAKNQDWPDADQIAQRLARLLPPNLLAPEEKDMPATVQAFVMQLQQQLQQLDQQNQQLMEALTDQREAIELQREKQDQDFEAKLLAIAQKSEAESSSNTMKLLDAFMQLREQIERPSSGETAES